MTKKIRPAKPKNPGRVALMVCAPDQVLLNPVWFRQHRPLVMVLTQGPLPMALGLVSHALQELGGRQGSLFGRLSDPQLLKAIAQGNLSLFQALALELSNHCLREPLDHIQVGPVNPANPASLICRWVVDAAVQITWSHRPQLRVSEYGAQTNDLLPFLLPRLDSALLAIRNGLRGFAQDDLAYAA